MAVITLAIFHGLITSLAMFGLGIGFSRALQIHSWVDRWGWPLQGLLGLSIAIIVAAVNIFIVHIPTVAFQGTVLAIGLILFSKNSSQRFASADMKLPHWSISFTLALWGAFLIKALAFPFFDPFDDHIFYLHQIKSLIERGELAAPFSNRRMYSYGGQSIAQSYFVLFQNIEMSHLFECGFINLLTIGFFKKWQERFSPKTLGQNRLFTVVISVLFLLTEQNRENLSALSSGFLYMFVLATLFTFDDSNLGERAKCCWTTSKVVTLAILMTAFASLKLTLFACALPLLFIFSIQLGIRRGLTLLLSFLVLLFPFVFGMFRDSQSLFYPVWRGYAFPAITYNGGAHWTDNLVYVMSVAWVSNFYLLLVFVPATYFLCDRKFIPIGIAASVTVAFAILNYNALGVELSSAARLLFPIVSGMLFYFVFFLYKEWIQCDPYNSLKRAIFYICLGSFSIANAYMIYKRVEIHRENLDIAGTSMGAILLENSKTSKALRSLQSHVEPHIPMVTYLTRPYLLDLRRNPIHNLDQVGEAAALGYFPVSPVHFAEYFKQSGYRYFLFVDPKFADEPYSSHRWQTPRRFTPRLPGKNFIDAHDLINREKQFQQRRALYLPLLENLSDTIQYNENLLANDRYYLQKL